MKERAQGASKNLEGELVNESGDFFSNLTLKMFLSPSKYGG